MPSVTITAIEGIALVKKGDDLAELILAALERMKLALQPADILLICQKVVSKSEGRIVMLKDIEPSPLAKNFAARWDKDPRAVELVMRHTRRIVRMDHGVLIAETGPGWICANAGMDESNSSVDGFATLLPEDADRSAAQIRAKIKERTGVSVAVLVTDTFGRPWRKGLTEVCIGVAGIKPMLDLRGTDDLRGRKLHHTVVAVADELAGAAGLLMEKASGIPAVLVRGYRYQPRQGSAKALIRPARDDLFR